MRRKGKFTFDRLLFYNEEKLSAFVKKTCRMEDNTLAYLQNNGSNNNNV